MQTGIREATATPLRMLSTMKIGCGEHSAKVMRLAQDGWKPYTVKMFNFTT